MILSLIVAMSKNGVIGCENKLPWHLPEDLKHFKKVTMGKPVIMGRKTFESIGRILPGRKNIIISRQRDLKIEGVEVASSLGDAIKLCVGVEEAFVIGGAQIYLEALPRVTRLYITEIDKEFLGDAKFPEIDLNGDFRILSREEYRGAEFGYAFITAERLA